MVALGLGLENALDFLEFDIAVRIECLVVLRSSSDPLMLPLRRRDLLQGGSVPEEEMLRLSLVGRDV